MHVSKRITTCVIRTFLAVVVMGVSLAFLPNISMVQAAEDSPLNLTLSPISLSLEAHPGEVVQTTLKIRNNNASAEKLKISFGSFVADDSGQNPKLIDVDADQEFLKWLTVDEPTFEVAPNEWKNIGVTFSPPADAALSYYYTVVVSQDNEGAVIPGATKVEGAPAILVLTTVVVPQAKREIQLESFTVQHSFLEFLPQAFTLAIKNTGNVHVNPTGNIFIDGQEKKDLAVLSINPGNGSILPQSKRPFVVNWSDGFPHRSAQDKKLVWNFDEISHLRFGKYTAHVVLVYDNGERDVPIESFVTFWIIPWRIIATVIAIPVIPSVFVFLIMKWKYDKKSKQS